VESGSPQSRFLNGRSGQASYFSRRGIVARALPNISSNLLIKLNY
jgi:hypothetical protein